MTCGNTRCKLHDEFPEVENDVRPALTTLELPFAYEEHGESKFALVKVVLCQKCCKKLMWKRNKEKEQRHRAADETVATAVGSGADDAPSTEDRGRRDLPTPDEHGTEIGMPAGRSRDGRHSDRSRNQGHVHHRKRSSRSRSPRRRKEYSRHSPL